MMADDVEMCEFSGFGEQDIISGLLVCTAFDEELEDKRKSGMAMEASTSSESYTEMEKPEGISSQSTFHTSMQSSKSLPDYLPKPDESLQEYVSRAISIAKSHPKKHHSPRAESQSKVSADLGELKPVIALGSYKELLNSRSKSLEIPLSKRQKELQKKLMKKSSGSSLTMSRSGSLMEDEPIVVEQAKEPPPKERGEDTSTRSLVPDRSDPECMKKSSDEVSLCSQIPSLIHRAYRLYMNKTNQNFDDTRLKEALVCLEKPASDEIPNSSPIPGLFYSKTPDTHVELVGTGNLDPTLCTGPNTSQDFDRSARKRSKAGKKTCPCCIADPSRPNGAVISEHHHVASSSGNFDSSTIPQLDPFAVKMEHDFELEDEIHTSQEKKLIGEIGAGTRVTKRSPLKKLVLARCKGCLRLRLLERSNLVNRLKLCRKCIKPFEEWLDAPWNYVYTKCENGDSCNVVKCDSCWFWHCVNLVKRPLLSAVKRIDKGTEITNDDPLDDSLPLSKIAKRGCLKGRCSNIRYVCRRPPQCLGSPFKDNKDNQSWLTEPVFRLSALPPAVKKGIHQLEWQTYHEDEQPLEKPQRKILSNGATLVIRGNQSVGKKQPLNVQHKNDARRSREGHVLPPFSLGPCMTVRNQKKQRFSSGSDIQSTFLTQRLEPPQKKAKYGPTNGARRSKKSTQTMEPGNSRESASRSSRSSRSKEKSPEGSKTASLSGLLGNLEKTDDVRDPTEILAVQIPSETDFAVLGECLTPRLSDNDVTRSVEAVNVRLGYELATEAGRKHEENPEPRNLFERLNESFEEPQQDHLNTQITNIVSRLDRSDLCSVSPESEVIETSLGAISDRNFRMVPVPKPTGSISRISKEAAAAIASEAFSWKESSSFSILDPEDDGAVLRKEDILSMEVPNLGVFVKSLADIGSVKWAAKHSLIANQRFCTYTNCRGRLRLTKIHGRRSQSKWRCENRGKKNSINSVGRCLSCASLRKGSLFFQSHSSTFYNILLLYCWSEFPELDIKEILELASEKGMGDISESNAASMYTRIQKFAQNWAEKIPVKQLGGPGKVCELQVSRLISGTSISTPGKEQGHFLVWEWDSRDVICIPAGKLNLVDLINSINRHIRNGTTLVLPEDKILSRQDIVEAGLASQFPNKKIELRSGKMAPLRSSNEVKFDEFRSTLEKLSVQSPVHAGYLYNCVFRRAHGNQKIFQNLLVAISEMFTFSDEKPENRRTQKPIMTDGEILDVWRQQDTRLGLEVFVLVDRLEDEARMPEEEQSAFPNSILGWYSDGADSLSQLESVTQDRSSVTLDHMKPSCSGKEDWSLIPVERRKDALFTPGDWLPLVRDGVIIEKDSVEVPKVSIVENTDRGVTGVEIEETFCDGIVGALHYIEDQLEKEDRGDSDKIMKTAATDSLKENQEEGEIGVVLPNQN